MTTTPSLTMTETRTPLTGTPMPCSWCDSFAVATVTEREGHREWTEIACEGHIAQYWPHLALTAEPRCEVCGGRGCNH